MLNRYLVARITIARSSAHILLVKKIHRTVVLSDWSAGYQI
ncbi:MAG: hypothetical protein Q8M57_14475 [Nitrosomonas sp.]|nr:hypothetical protein [Nitrosomonas sp.]